MEPERGTVLVVDDEAQVRRLITLVLQRRDYKVVEAANGRVALARLQEQPFDLVITDLQMPEMGGLSLLEKCRAFYSETDIIVLTAYGTIQNAVWALKQGAEDFLTKPFDIVELAHKVDACFAQRRARLKVSGQSVIEPLMELSRLLASQAGLTETIEGILDLIQRTFKPASIEVASLERDARTIVVARSGPSPEELGYPRPSRREMEWLAQQEEPWLLRERGAADAPERRPHSGLGVTVPLLGGEEVVGACTLVRPATKVRFTQADAQLLQVFGVQIGLSILHSRTHQRLLDVFRDLNRATMSTVQTLFAAIETYDQYTHDHSERVSRCAYLLGQRLGLSEDEAETLRIAGLLHDVGKLGVGDDTLHKNGDLTSAELDRVKLHPVMGAKILEGMEAFATVVPMVLYHHEWFDGSGYPHHLAGEKIPFGARIIAIVDAYDSMTSDRPYRPALSPDEALERIGANANIQFDGRLTRIGCEVLREYATGGNPDTPA